MSFSRTLISTVAIGAVLTPTVAAMAAASTTTPIQHVIVIVGENHTFDNVFGTYQPQPGQTVSNLLSKGIVKADGTPGPHFALAQQNIGLDTLTYKAVTPSTGAYATLPQPYTSDNITLPNNVLDTRFPANLQNGPYQISKYVPYASFTPDPVHRFFQMWQDVDGGLMDKFVWVEETIGTGSNGATYPYGSTFNPHEGTISLGFYNMNPYTDAKGNAQPGDAPFFKSLADSYALSDNYHQAIMGGTGANFQSLVTGHAAYYTNTNGTAGTPFSNQIENPNPRRGTNNYYTEDGYSGGSYVNCADDSQPGVAPIKAQLLAQGVVNANCAANTYYLVNNYNMYWNADGSTNTLGATSYVLPPQSAPTIADVMTANGISWKYYSGDRGADATNFPTSIDGIPLYFHYYCSICDPLAGYTKIETNPTESAKLQSYTTFLADVANNTLPAVSYVRPFEALAGHPGDSQTYFYEDFLEDLIAHVKANPALWASTAIFITTDEGGGYYDSGYIQAVDFFGDGTRIPFLAVSPYAKHGYVDHTYYDHASILKFIEKNWGLPTISARSRDHLPNPVAAAGNPYVPTNGPAIGDLSNLFDFSASPPQ